jgi:quinol monooxygenase YgiN
MYERFKSVAALDDHLKQAHTMKLLAAIGALADGGPMAKVYQVPD